MIAGYLEVNQSDQNIPVLFLHNFQTLQIMSNRTGFAELGILVRFQHISIITCDCLICKSFFCLSTQKFTSFRKRKRPSDILIFQGFPSSMRCPLISLRALRSRYRPVFLWIQVYFNIGQSTCTTDTGLYLVFHQ